MSVRVSQWVWDFSKAEGNDRLVLLKIADNCNDEGMNAFPSVKHIANKCKLSTRTVQRCVASLEEIGELTIHRRPGTSNIYVVNMNRTKDEAIKAANKVEKQALKESHVEPEPVVDEAEVSVALILASNPQLEKKDPKPRKQDSIWDAVLGVCGIDSSTLNNAERGRHNRAVSLLKESGATEQEIAVRAIRYRRKFGKVAMTPIALANHWSELGDNFNNDTDMQEVVPQGWNAIKLARQQRQALNG